ncbi:MAG: PDZ domain-containing protein [Bryobacteraceae bacterium]|jgi:serine protease Do
MKQVTYSGLCILVLGATAAGVFAQDPAPRARAATARSIVIRKSGGSFLGIGVAEVDAERAKALNLKEVRGVEVKSVDPDSPAAKAGMKEGDVVLEFNGQPIEGTEQFVRLVHETPVNRQVKMQVWRNGAPETLTATIASRMQVIAGRAPDADEAFTVEMPPMSEMPPMPEMPSMPPMPPTPAMPGLRIYGTSRSGMLGIDCESVGGQLAGFFGVKEGALVREVFKGSAAEKAGLRAGDVIVKVDGETVTSAREITSVLRAARVKHTFAVVVVRDKKEITLQVAMESGGARGMRPVVSSGRWC